MKKIALILFAFLTYISVFAQITLENSYPNTNDAFIDKDFGLVNLGNATYKYYFVDKGNSQLTLYNLNHTVYKNISISITGTKYVVSYISNTLFDCDSSNIEYLITTSYTNSVKWTRIYDETGTLLFNENNSVATESKVKVLNNGTNLLTSVSKDIIFNTPSGTKMILPYTDGSTKIYSLCGTLSAVSIKDVNNLNELQLFDAYPNPSINSTRIDYILPKGITQGKLVIYNIRGEEVKKYTIGNQFNFITISTHELPAGTYFYNLQTSTGITGSKKMIKINN